MWIRIFANAEKILKSLFAVANQPGYGFTNTRYDKVIQRYGIVY